MVRRGEGGAILSAAAGTAVRDGKFEFRVTGIQHAKQAGDLTNEFETVTAQGEFIIVSMTVTNIGNAQSSFEDEAQKLIDASGHQYDSSGSAALVK
jgi:Domain of unknown function (DUF4352)